MKKKRKTFSRWNHLHPKNIFDRGSPLMRIFVSAFLLILVGTFSSLLNIFVWIGGFIMIVGVLAVAFWLYLELS